MRCGIGLDLGGSGAKIGLISERGEVLAEEKVAMDAEEALLLLQPVAEAVDQLRELAASRDSEVVAIGCGISGYLDPTGTRIDLNNIPALGGFPLGAWFRERFDLPVSIDNDACLAAIAETSLMKPDEAHRLLFVTVGSGIGVVLVVDGSVVRIMRGETGEAGHILVDHTSQERCPMGCHGCLETVASARAIARAGQRAAVSGASGLLASVLGRHGRVTGADVSAAASKGDAVAREIIRQAGHWFGIGLASWAPVYEPELVLLGGAVVGAGQEWMAAAVKTMREFGHPFLVEKIRVRRAALGNQAGIIGAALVAMQDEGHGHSKSRGR